MTRLFDTASLIKIFQIFDTLYSYRCDFPNLRYFIFLNHTDAIPLVFGLGRIFRLERSAIFMTEFWARLELGAVNCHLKPCMFTWAKIGSPFEVIILALYSNVASYHLISTRFLITTSFMISIKWPVDYPIYTYFNEPSHLPCPSSNIGLRTSKQCLPPCGG